jgi:dimethylargininase
MTTSDAGKLVAITHVPSPNMHAAERTFVDHGDDVDYELALRQHAGYRAALERCGAEIVILDVNRTMPDCVFVEDTAIVLREVAVMMSPGAESRRAEPAGIEPALRPYREIKRIKRPATIDGGDVVVAGRSVYVGESQRTNADGILALRETLAPFGYSVTGVPVHGCLHLKTACSALPDGRFLVNADWIDVSPLPRARLVSVPSDEPWAGDVLVIGNDIIFADTFPQTGQMLGSFGYRTLPVTVSEFAKVEGGVTCLSLVFDA